MNRRTVRMLGTALIAVAFAAGWAHQNDNGGTVQDWLNQVTDGSSAVANSVKEGDGPAGGDGGRAGTSVGVTPAQKATAQTQLRGLKVLPSRPKVAGYERDCAPSQGCVFGPAWHDDNTAPSGHNGCGTRDDVLRAQLKNPVIKQGSRCTVVSGTLNDLYTGRTITFEKSKAQAVQIDHVYPLARAWDFGASSWPIEKRRSFANDVAANLLAVDGPTNTGKGDQGPEEWLPPNKAYRCGYAVKYIGSATKYGLAIDRGDQRVLQQSLAAC
ncbi:HNH endonuclease family protein [Luteipulveratus flavus]|uniref:HNH endonuclease family protein n=1 Tax=Luteipulveratus flavus TaxID=3031728 RepID=A0ABT6CAW0_9MICO|nr:HNH endonuclease family protein [Luteipulveratus sp. YIM 133296]MDF8265194.1 HNH endonuclease family protein [Luteipulveratus sp. YIM 133296]